MQYRLGYYNHVYDYVGRIECADSVQLDAAVSSIRNTPSISYYWVRDETEEVITRMYAGIDGVWRHSPTL